MIIKDNAWAFTACLLSKVLYLREGTVNSLCIVCNHLDFICVSIEARLIRCY